MVRRRSRARLVGGLRGRQHARRVGGGRAALRLDGGAHGGGRRQRRARGKVGLGAERVAGRALGAPAAAERLGEQRLLSVGAIGTVGAERDRRRGLARRVGRAARLEARLCQVAPQHRCVGRDAQRALKQRRRRGVGAAAEGGVAGVLEGQRRGVKVEAGDIRLAAKPRNLGDAARRTFGGGRRGTGGLGRGVGGAAQLGGALHRHFGRRLGGGGGRGRLFGGFVG